MPNIGRALLRIYFNNSCCREWHRLNMLHFHAFITICSISKGVSYSQMCKDFLPTILASCIQPSLCVNLLASATFGIPRCRFSAYCAPVQSQVLLLTQETQIQINSRLKSILVIGRKCHAICLQFWPTNGIELKILLVMSVRLYPYLEKYVMILRASSCCFCTEFSLEDQERRKAAVYF